MPSKTDDDVEKLFADHASGLAFREYADVSDPLTSTDVAMGRVFAFPTRRNEMAYPYGGVEFPCELKREPFRRKGS
jgi:hypothetical protein